MQITEATKDDFDDFWPILKGVIAAQETYALNPAMSKMEAFKMWCEEPAKTFVIKKDGAVLGSYYIKPNGYGPASHICNCGYIVTPHAKGGGLATKMCKHSWKIAKQLGFDAMQFNAVVSTNTTAVNLWKRLGYEIIGTIPNAYNHRRFGLVDSYIMHKDLSSHA